jgi:WD40 repeat protein
MWDAASGTEMIPPLEGHQGGVLAVVFSHDGNHIASGSVDHTVRVWDAMSRAEIAPPLQHHHHGDGVTLLAFSPDGTHIVSGSDDNLMHVWDVGCSIRH